MARMIMSAGSSELYHSRKRPPPYSSQCGVLKRLKVVRDEVGEVEDENENEEKDEEKGEDGKEEEPDLCIAEMEEDSSRISLHSGSEHVFTPYMPSTAAHTIHGFTLRYNENGKDEMGARTAQSIVVVSGSGSETVRPDTVQLDLKSQALSPRQHTPIPTSSKTPSSDSDPNPNPTPLSTHRLILKARTHLHSARVKISRHPRSRYIDTPEAGWTGVLNKRKRGEERVVEERGCPKRVLMEGMYPGLGMRVLDGLRERVSSDGGVQGLARKMGRGWRGEGREGEGVEAWGGFELVAGRAVGD